MKRWLVHVACIFAQLKAQQSNHPMSSWNHPLIHCRGRQLQNKEKIQQMAATFHA